MKTQEKATRHIAAAAKQPGQKMIPDREKLLDETKRAIRTLTGSFTDDAASRLLFQIQLAHVWPRVDEDAALKVALSAIREMSPRNAIEGMLMAQMIAVQNAALMFMDRATHEERYQEAVERNLILSSRCMRVFLEQVEALQRLQGKTGQQKVVVEHVHVNEGGQAIVGAVAATSAAAKGGGV